MEEVSKSLKDAVLKIVPHFPIDEEPMIETMSKPVIIESACPGWQLASRFPAVPISIEDQVKEITESIQAGAIVTHIHPRDPKDGSSPISVDLLVEVMNGVLANVGDCVTLQHTWTYDPDTKVVDYVSDTEELLEKGEGNRYCQGSVVLPANRLGMSGQLFTSEITWNAVRYLESKSIKPIYQLYDTYAHFDLWQYAIRTGISTFTPYVLNLHLGKHHSHTVHKDPWSRLQLIANYNMVAETIPNSVVGVYPGGRNWLPILIEALMLGAPLVRVGIEDCYWIWPHKNEIIKKNSDTVKMAVELCNILGRRVVTDPVEARELLGLRLTSPLLAKSPTTAAASA